MTIERERLRAARERTEDWKRWGPYLSERAWGTVREDYSRQGAAWDYFPHAHARMKAYRWNEDGLGGISDRHQHLCFAIALWNGRDPFLKERLYGVTGSEANHGEDVKEYYFYLDSTPTHSYMKFLYKYPQAEFPYDRLVDENRRRDRHTPEYELLDTGVFDEDRYFDVQVEYAKAGPDDLLIRIAATNRGPEAAPLHLLPTLWYRNTWTWDDSPRPRMRAVGNTVVAEHPELGSRTLHCEGAPPLLFTENDTNFERVYGQERRGTYLKDAFHDYVVDQKAEAVNPELTGTKAAAHYVLNLAPGETQVITLRLTDRALAPTAAFTDADPVVAARQAEADAYYAAILPTDLPEEPRRVVRQALAGMLWTKQFYHYVVQEWLDGDPAFPAPPAERHEGRNRDWKHLHNADVISMPDKWEYPWYAAWDLAFHCLPLALVDSDFAKDQLLLMLREWYMHPNGQIPAYEWNYGDVNPPVHAWGAWRVYQFEKARDGVGDRGFLERVFHKLLINFTWWVNRKDALGNNLFEGGFLGLDNIGVFDRSAPLPTGGFIEQSDGTSWMAFYTLTMLAIALELAQENPAYEDVASKFLEHFVAIDHAMHHLGADGYDLWDEADGFYYDVLHLPNGQHLPMKVRSMVGLIPLFAAETLAPEQLDKVPGFKARMEWLLANRPDLVTNSAGLTTPNRDGKLLLSIVDPDQLQAVLRRMLDETEFLSDFGVRSLSRIHLEHPYVLTVDRTPHRVDYAPAESTTAMFGGNSNWRGPIWFPVNYLLIESLRRFHQYLGPDFKVECPVGSGRFLDLEAVSHELSERLARMFLPDAAGRRPVYGATPKFQDDPHWKDLVLFYEYFHGDTGFGLGASHQTGWSGLVATMILESHAARIRTAEAVTQAGK